MMVHDWRLARKWNDVRSSANSTQPSIQEINVRDATIGDVGLCGTDMCPFHHPPHWIPMSKHLLLFAAVSIFGGAITAFADPYHDHVATEDAAPEKQTNASAYPLTTCPVSGEKLGAMGKPFKTEIDEREVQFCCKGCVPKDDEAKKKLFAKMDEMIIAQQKRDYPRYCIVSGETFEEEDAVDYVYDNQLVRFCCKKCKADFEKDPAGYIKKVQDLRKNGIPKDTSSTKKSDDHGNHRH